MTCSILVGGAWGDEGKGNVSLTFVIMISHKLLLVQVLDLMQGIPLNLTEKNMV